MPDGAPQASKATYRCFIGQGMEAVTWAMQLAEVTAQELVDQFGTQVKMLSVYGAKLLHGDRLYAIEFLKA